MKNFNLQKQLAKLSLMFFLAIAFTNQISAQNQINDGLRLQFSDGRPDALGFEKVNAVLKQIGVHGTLIAIPKEVKPLLDLSSKRALTAEETKEVSSFFSMDREALMKQIKLAGRVPVVVGGGSLGTIEVGNTPYPKVYDMMSWSAEGQADGLRKYGTFHVNSSDDGTGIDEVMTVVAGGSFTWFFVLPDNTMIQLTVKRIGKDDKAVRLSYPGLGIHAGYMNPKDGLIVAYAHGPKDFVMRYKSPGIRGEKFLGTNPWVDFTTPRPTIIDITKK
ncbi:hypothetical protein [Flavobacterium bizetiae]|uniref:hypothetical protein n=1 Tax=Flavobacterium bizetiae TaxID=2704140 RepID=UPI0037583B11